MIEQKKKICSVCGNKTYLFRSNPPTCKQCIPNKKIIARTPLKKSVAPIKQVSEKRKITLSQYSPKRKEFLKKNPFCGLRLSNCTNDATVIHHLQGKSSEELYLDETKWMASCSNCNLNVESYPLAYEKGLKIRRNQI